MALLALLLCPESSASYLRRRVKARAQVLSWQPLVSVQEPDRHSDDQGDHLHMPSLQLPPLRPMSLARRLGGCFILLLLACLPYLTYVYLAKVLPTMLSELKGAPFFIFYSVGMSLVLPPLLFFSVAKEAQRSQLGRMLRADVVPVADFFSPNSVLAVSETELLAFRDDATANIPFQRSGREGVSSQSSNSAGATDDAVISSKHEVLRLRLPVCVTLEDAEPDERRITLQHQLYFEGKEQLSVQVQHQNGKAVISRTWAGLPSSFRLLRITFTVSVCLMLSWVPRIVVLLCFPSWVDPAFSDVYLHRKRLFVGGGV